MSDQSCRVDLLLSGSNVRRQIVLGQAIGDQRKRFCVTVASNARFYFFKGEPSGSADKATRFVTPTRKFREIALGYMQTQRDRWVCVCVYTKGMRVIA